MAPATALAVFAGKTVAAAVIKEILSKAFGYLNAYFGAETMAELKSKLDRGMPKIQAVLDICSPDEARDKSGALDAWFWQLRDAVEKAEDAVSELEYYELEEKAHDRKVSHWGTSFAKMKHKAVKNIKNVSILDKTVKGFTRRGTLKRLREAVEDLYRAAESSMDFFTLAEHLKGCTGQLEKPSPNRDRETASMLTATEVFGRRKEKEVVIESLTNTSGEDAEIVVSNDPVSVVSIVGHGGMGKTTLAQLICQDDYVKKHFEMVIWACISTSFDAMTVTRKILESATGGTPNADTLEGLQKILSQKLNSVKFLLILDDAWDDSKTDRWEKLFAPLRTGRKGSKILLTTRMQSVADLAANAMGAQNHCLRLKGLKEDENIKLFNRHAFPSDSFQNYQSLQTIGERIAKNLGGCPLVTKVVASHLRDNLSFQYWSNFLHQRLEHFGATAEDIMNVLKLSYCHLPTEMQTCFRYCSIFPQDFVFDKAQLVKMWISSGLISQVAVGSESLVSTGEQYLTQLTRKSFFDYASYGEEKYVMHDLMHDLAKYVSSGECAQIVGVASLENVANTVRHICIEHINNLPVEKVMEITHLEELRTIIIKDKHNSWQEINNVTLNIVEELVQSSKSLRLFQTELQHTSDFIAKLALLKHLRFVELQQIPPESIRGVGKLYHLTTLECRHVQIEQKQLRDVANIEADVNLMKLCISNFSGTIIPLWAEKRPLQNLVWLELKRSGICNQLLALDKLLTLKTLKLENLPTLKKIGQELDVSGYECTDELFWPPNLHTLQVIECPELKEMPLLPPRLNSLHIEKVGLTKFPGMGKLQNDENEKIALQRWLEITIQPCQSLTSLEGSLFEELQYVRTLHLLRISDCVQLESGPLALRHMCRLKEIEISYCPKLRALDLYLTSSNSELEELLRKNSERSLSKVSIVKCESLSSLDGLESFIFHDFLPTLEITGCCQLAKAGLALYLDVSGGRCNFMEIGTLRIDLPSLLLVEPLKSLSQTNHLVIMDGSEMETLPEGWLLQNQKLKSLEVFQAKSLQSLPSSMQDLCHLEKLYLESAAKLTSLPHLPSSLKELYILRCHLELEKKFRQTGRPESNKLIFQKEARNKVCHVQRVQIVFVRAEISFRS